MENGPPYDEIELGELLGMLPAAPDAWVEAAKQRPRIERGVTQILALAEADAEFRAALIEDLETTVREADVEASPEVVDAVRARIEG